MEYKIFILLIIFSMSLSLISATDLECSLTPFYMEDGAQIHVYSNATSFDGISFSIQCKNNIKNARIIPINIIDASPKEFKNSLPNISADLRILQTKILWVSKIISTKDFKNEQEINFSIIVSGYNEKTLQEINATYVMPIYIKRNSGKVFYSFGKRIFPSQPEIGVFIIFFIIFVGGYLVWEYDLTKRIEQHKRRRMAKRLEKYKQKETYERMQ